MTGLGHDVRHAFRLLVKDPGFTAVAVITLALAIGVNTSVFGIVNAVLFKPLPVEDPEGLVHIYTAMPDGFLSHEPMAHPDFEDVRDEVKSLSHVVGYAFTGFVLATGEDNELILGELASGNYFETLGLRPAAGRFYSLQDDRRGAANSVAVLSYSTWQKRFGGDPSIVGSEIRLNGHPVTVLGVAPEGFHGLTRGLSAELWIPVQLSRTVTAASTVNTGEETEVHRLDARRGRWLWVVGRLRADATPEQAASELSVVGQRLATEYPDTNENRSIVLVPHDQVRIMPGVDTALFAASGVVMGMVCVFQPS